MNELTPRRVHVPRSLFLEGHAECRTCGAHVRPTAQTSAYVRAAGAPTAIAWCSVCCATNVYSLDPQAGIAPGRIVGPNDRVDDPSGCYNNSEQALASGGEDLRWLR
jgi:hypothetical protein